MADLVGELFGNYRLLRQVGHGGFADVYLGEHVYLRTQAAIKVLQVQLTDDALESFLGEARTIIQLEHPHIVRVLECGVEKNLPFLVLTYAPGGALRQRHPRGARLPLERISLYISQIASALQYAHDRKLIHRDIKPENILISQHDTLLLSDFGLVLLMQSTNAHTQQEMAGTVPYMAPEQLQGKPQPASDQYALGIMAYEWLSGERPYNGSFVEIASQHVLSTPPLLYGRIPGLSRETEKVVLTALAKNPRDRFPSVQEFARALAATAEASARQIDVSEVFSETVPSPSPEAGSLLTKTPPSALSAFSLSSQQSFYSTPVLGSSFRVPHIDERPTLPVAAVGQAGFSAPVKDMPLNLASSFSTHIKSTPPVSFVPSETNTLVPNSHFVTAEPPFVPPKASSFGIGPSPQRRRKSFVYVLAVLVLAGILLLGLTPILLPKVQQAFDARVGAVSTSTAASLPMNMTGGTAVSTQQAPAGYPTPTHSAGHLTPTASPGNTKFSVTTISVSASPGSYQGVCATALTLTFTGTIHASPGPSGGTVSYAWLRSDNTRGPTQTVVFNPGDSVKTVTTTWRGPTSPGTTTLWEALTTTTPNAVASQHTSVKFVCEAPSAGFTVTNISISGSEDPTSISTCGPPVFYVSATLSISAGSPGGKITYTWERSDGTTSGPSTVTVAAGQTQVTVTDTWNAVYEPTNLYWVKLKVSAPNSINSNQTYIDSFVC